MKSKHTTTDYLKYIQNDNNICEKGLKTFHQTRDNTRKNGFR